MLKRVGSYCVIVIVLLYTTPLQQLLKVPAMLEHYGEHKRQKESITFLDFIFMHYIGDDGVADDDSKDMQLPFKKANTTSYEAYGCAVMPMQMLKNEYAGDIHYSPFKKQLLPYPDMGKLIKPPQV